MNQNYYLSREAAPDEALNLLFRELNDNIGHNLLAFHDNIVFSVHEIRKTIKKIRVLLKLAKPCLDKQNFKFLNKRYRDLGKLLSDVRDAHIRAQILHDYAACNEDSCPSEDFLTLFRFQTNLIQRINFDKKNPNSIYSIFCNYFRSIGDSELSGLNGDRKNVSAYCLLNSYILSYTNGYEHHFTVANKNTLPSEFHELRKHVKNLQYMSEFLSERINLSFPECTPEKSTQLSEILGKHHDFHIVIEWIRQINKEEFQFDKRNVLNFLSDLNKNMEKDISDKAGKLYSVSPKNFSQAVQAASSV